MSGTAIFLVGVFVFGLCVAFVALSARELRRLGRDAELRRDERR